MLPTDSGGWWDVAGSGTGLVVMGAPPCIAATIAGLCVAADPREDGKLGGAEDMAMEGLGGMEEGPPTRHAAGGKEPCMGRGVE